MSAVGDEFVSEHRELRDPDTGRRMVQLTSGECFDYALYYFIPSMTQDGRTVVFHRHAGEEVQLYRLDIDTGRTVRLTDASTPNALWRPWLQAPGFGVRDQLSAFSPASNELVYFDSNDVHTVNIETLDDRVVHHVPDDRVPCGLTGISPDGKHFVFPHADRTWWEANLARGPERHTARGTCLDVLDLQSGSVRTLLQINSWLTHANFLDDRRVLFCHPPTENGLLMTDLRGGWHVHLRASDGVAVVCHHHATRRGISYEAHPCRLGLMDPDTYAREEWIVDCRAISHIGRDDEARLWFFEAPIENDVHGICFMPELDAARPCRPETLLSPMVTHRKGQQAHLHPALTPDRRHILFTGGDDRTRTNHLFLLDVADLNDTASH